MTYLFLSVVALLFSVVAAAHSWNKVSVAQPYVPRGETSFTLCARNKLCLLGGRGLDPVSILDTETFSWSNGKKPPKEIHHFQAFQGPDNCAWVVGAWTGAYPAETTVDNILKYCPDSDQWSTGPAIERPRGAGGAFLYDGAVYLVSGNVGGHNINAKLVNWFDKLDLGTGKWSQLPDVPHPRDHFHAVVVGNRLYVAGGRDSTGNAPDFFDDVETKVDVFDFDSQEWSTLDDFPRPRGGTFATALGTDVFVLGGEGMGRAWAEVDVLDGIVFKPGEDMPIPRHGAGAVACNNAIWVAGGVSVQGGGEKAADTVAYYDGDKPPVCGAPAETATTTAPSTTAPATITVTEVTTSTTTEEDTASNVEGSDGQGEDASEAEAGNSSGEESGESSDGNGNEEDGIAAGEAEDSSGEGSGGSSDGNGSEADNGSGEADNNENAEATPSEEPSGPACFPSDAIVELSDGTSKTMSELQIGDIVKVSSSGEYSPIYFFSHRHSKSVDQFVRISTATGGIEVSVSAGHLVYVNGRRVPASTVQVGDQIAISHKLANTAIVIATTRVTSRGLHNPHTLHGDIVVNGVVSSTFTSAVHPSVAQLLLIPFRLAYKMFGTHSVVQSLNHAVLRTLDYCFWGRH